MASDRHGDLIILEWFWWQRRRAREHMGLVGASDDSRLDFGGCCHPGMLRLTTCSLLL